MSSEVIAVGGGAAASTRAVDRLSASALEPKRTPRRVKALCWETVRFIPYPPDATAYYSSVSRAARDNTPPADAARQRNQAARFRSPESPRVFACRPRSPPYSHETSQGRLAAPL